MVPTRVSELGGVTSEIVSGLHALGIDYAEQLLAATNCSAARAGIAAKLGLDAEEILDLANSADLTRINGLTKENIELLVLAGVDRVAELRRRIPENLYVKLLEVSSKRCKSTITMDDVRRWVNEARQLERALYFD